MAEAASTLDEVMAEAASTADRGHGRGCVHGGRGHGRGCAYVRRDCGRGCVHGGRGVVERELSSSHVVLCAERNAARTVWGCRARVAFQSAAKPERGVSRADREAARRREGVGRRSGRGRGRRRRDVVDMAPCALCCAGWLVTMAMGLHAGANPQLDNSASIQLN